ncbi:MAG: lipopolysaccharide biosynthesis protein [bacterium]
MGLLDKIQTFAPFHAVKKISYLSGIRFYTYSTSFLYGIVAARILGPGPLGQLFSIIAMVKLSCIPFQLNTQQTVVKLYGEQEKQPNRTKIFTTTLLLNLAALCLFLVLFFTALILFFNYWDIYQDWQTSLGLYAVSEALLHLRIFGSYFQATEQFKWLGVYRLINATGRNLFLIPFLFYGVQAACLGYLIVELGLFLASILLLLSLYGKKLLNVLKVNELISYEIINSIYHNTRSNYLANIFNSLFTKGQVLIIHHLVGTKPVSYFKIGKRFRFVFQFFSKPANNYLYPRLVKKWNTDQDEFYDTLRKYYYQAIPLITTLCLILCVGVIWLIPFLYGPDFSPSITVAWIVLPAVALSNIFALTKSKLFAISKQRVILNVNILQAILGVILALVLTYYFSYIGAAWAFALRMYFMNFYTIRIFFKELGTRWILPSSD